MKFNIKTSLLIGAAVIICSLVLVSSLKGRTKRSESMMEYMNNFFSENTNNNNNLEKTKANGDKHHKKHKKHNKAKKGNSHFRFKEHTSALKKEKFAKTKFGQDPILTTNPNMTIAPNTTLILSDWFMISSPIFADTKRFPPVQVSPKETVTIKTDMQFYRINEAYDKYLGEPDDKGPSNKFFWFRLSGLNIYYSLSKTDINILDAISVTKISGVTATEQTMYNANMTYCFSVIDTDHNSWKMCALTKEISKTWVCTIKKILRVDDPMCEPEGPPQPAVIERNITQPIIIIPTPSPFCNENWNYQRNGADWNCDCEEGREQSPIDLPSSYSAIKSPVKPLFQYDEVSAVSKVSTLEGQMKENETIKIKLKDNALRIFHEKFGKVVTMDGAIYFAQEIVIHTPAEHTIMGKTYDMELQIIHYGQSKGDIAKQLILSFVFEKTPGVYNKFIDDLDIFNLPNPLTIERDLTNNIYIPKIFYSADDTDIPFMKPFSFYTYQGSLTAPPCSENTIMYVASQPIPLGTTAIQLFKEAIRVPDVINQNGDVLYSTWTPMSNRKIQPRNGRPVFHYDHSEHCVPGEDKSKIRPQGHYEKVIKAQTNYFYVNSKEPSGLPNSFVVSEAQAKGDPSLSLPPNYLTQNNL
jgi:carbonic anhydrase